MSGIWKLVLRGARQPELTWLASFPPCPIRTPAPASSVLQRLQERPPPRDGELRPPRTGLSSADTMELWIDMYHSIQRLARHDTIIFLTDNAVGLSEEENLAHLTANLAGDVDPSRIVPFLTSKHSIEYCLMHASRAASHGFEALTVLGGDHTVVPPAACPTPESCAASSASGCPGSTSAAGQIRIVLRPSRWTTCWTTGSRPSST